MTETFLTPGPMTYGNQARPALGRELFRAYPVQTAAFDDLLTAIDHADSGWRETQEEPVSTLGLTTKMLLPDGS